MQHSVNSLFHDTQAATGIRMFDRAVKFCLTAGCCRAYNAQSQQWLTDVLTRMPAVQQ